MIQLCYVGKVTPKQTWTINTFYSEIRFAS